MKQNIIIILTILISIGVIVATTLLLDLVFIQKYLIRQIIVYVLMSLELFIAVRCIQILKQ